MTSYSWSALQSWHTCSAGLQACRSWRGQSPHYSQSCSEPRTSARSLQCRWLSVFVNARGLTAITAGFRYATTSTWNLAPSQAREHHLHAWMAKWWWRSLESPKHGVPTARMVRSVARGPFQADVRLLPTDVSRVPSIEACTGVADDPDAARCLAADVPVLVSLRVVTSTHD
jgi:hypothetical protein